jgi:hypothetical protein
MPIGVFSTERDALTSLYEIGDLVELDHSELTN